VNPQALPTSAPSTSANDVAVAIGIVAADEVALCRLAAAAADSGLTVVSEALSLDDLAAAPDVGAVVVAFDPGSPAVRDSLRDVKESGSDAPVVAVIKSDSASAIRRALRGGADGVVFEPQLEVVLGPAVRAVVAGQVTVPQSARSHVERQPLSSREKQVLGLVVMGFTNGEIGQQLYLAESTIKSHLSSAFSKLGVRSRKEAVALILDPEEGLGMGILAIAEPKSAAAHMTARRGARFDRPTVTEGGLLT
jgi:DNA-binding NarL/FixJ family response regulator